MGLFSRKSKWDIFVDSTEAALKGGAVRTIGKLGTGLVAGLASVTAVSAAISSARHQEQQ